MPEFGDIVQYEKHVFCSACNLGQSKDVIWRPDEPWKEAWSYGKDWGVLCAITWFVWLGKVLWGGKV